MDRNTFSSVIAGGLLLMASVRPLAAQSVQLPGESVLGVMQQSAFGRHKAEAAVLARLSAATAEKQPDQIQNPRQLAAWIVDAVEPDAMHVTQTGWGGNQYLYDEWIIIREDEYDNTGLWMKAAMRGRRALGPGLGLRKYAQVLQHEQPVSSDGYGYAGKTYSSLSEIAMIITGTRWNGPRFFGLRQKALNGK